MSRSSTLDRKRGAKKSKAPGPHKQGTSGVSPSGTDWDALRRMSEAEALAAATSDRDNPPLTRQDFARMKRRPRCFVIRRALRMTQEQFAEAFRIPVGTIRDWEQLRAEPDQAAKAYLKVIAVNPQYVMKALAHVPGQPAPSTD